MPSASPRRAASHPATALLDVWVIVCSVRLLSGFPFALE
jgi:hypothetical protein